MIYLLIVSLIWAFSFGLIKTNLTSLDPNFVSFVRMFLSLLVFLPFLRVKSVSGSKALKLIAIGAIQYGVMYITYIWAYQFLKSYEIALFTIFTPIFVTLFNDSLDRKFNKAFLLSSSAAVIGAGIILFKNIDSENFVLGFVLMQISNLCFAGGQIFYTRIKKDLCEVSNSSVFGFLYIGAVITTFIASIVTTDYSSIQINSDQIYTLVYLGIVSSGLAFYLWNVGATKVNAGTLAVFNNLKIPLAILVSLLVFQEGGDFIKLIIGGIILFLALYFTERRSKCVT